MKCPKCDGLGQVDRHQNCKHDCHDRYVYGCSEKKACLHCKGFGYTGVDLNRIKEFIQVVANNEPYFRKEANHILEQLQ